MGGDEIYIILLCIPFVYYLIYKILKVIKKPESEGASSGKEKSFKEQKEDMTEVLSMPPKMIEQLKMLGLSENDIFDIKYGGPRVSNPQHFPIISRRKLERVSNYLEAYLPGTKIHNIIVYRGDNSKYEDYLFCIYGLDDNQEESIQNANSLMALEVATFLINDLITNYYEEYIRVRARHITVEMDNEHTLHCIGREPLTDEVMSRFIDIYTPPLTVELNALNVLGL